MVAFVLILGGLAIQLAACGGDSQDSPAGTPARNQTAFCKQLDDTEQALKDVGDAARSLDVAKLQSSQAVLRANIDSLVASSESSGGSAKADVEQLLKDLQTLNSTLATPDLLPVIPTIKDQVAAINADITKAKQSANCPA